MVNYEYIENTQCQLQIYNLFYEMPVALYVMGLLISIWKQS